ETDEGADGNDGDWLWRDDDADDIEGDLDAGASSTTNGSPAPGGGDADAEGDESASASAGDSQGTRIPHVPKEGSDSPAGIPKDRGGSGGGATSGEGGTTTERGEHGEQSQAADAGTERRASGPHGGGVDEMATAYTYEAVQRLDDPRIALAETNEWSDWVGLVGDVPAHAINSFLREHQLDIDFFNGSGDGPAERLAAIDEHSMFYSERMVVVGTEGEEWIAEDADWEFVALSDAAEKAGWAFED
ncbi:MAG: hypothetical protein ABEH83_09025, partial [Halobacterium sp.]